MISFFTADIRFVVREKSALRLWLSEIARKEGFRIEEVNIILCSDEYLYQMNLTYLKHKTLTDIITFDNSTVKHVLSGELYISLDRARENAKSLNIRLKDELHRLFAHGFLHLCGYSDKGPLLKKKMTKKEDFYLALRPF